MQGFFSKKETESVAAAGGKIHSCASCGLYKHCQSPKMKPYGKGQKDLMIIGEFPEQIDDEKGRPFAGKYGRLLRQHLKRVGISLDRDCISLNAINCHPGRAEVENSSIAHCRSVIVWKAIKKYQPKVILLLGQAPTTSVIGQQWSGGDSIKTWRGFTIPDQDLKSWVCPTYSPNYLIDIDTPRQYMKIWSQDLKRAVDKIEEPFPRQSKPDIRLVEDLSFLEDISPVLSAFDYETTGIKPHAKGHQIVCTSIADREDRVWVFPSPKTKKDWLPFRRWLYNKEIPKMAHNMKFETSWSKNILKVDVRGWEWDSMLAAHIIDNRPGVTGLKFQTYATLGIRDYSTEVTPYLKSSGSEKGANEKNRIVQLMKSKSGRRQVMEYCGLDSIYQYRLAMQQMEIMNYDFLPF